MLLRRLSSKVSSSKKNKKQSRKVKMNILSGEVIMNTPIRLHTMSADEVEMIEIVEEAIEVAILEAKILMTTEAPEEVEAVEVAQEAEQEDQEVVEAATELKIDLNTRVAVTQTMIKKAVKNKLPKRSTNSWRIFAENTRLPSKVFAM